MRKRNRSDLLLVEILIAVLFFMISLAVLVQVFAASRNLTVRAKAKTEALAQAQSVADAMRSAEDTEQILTELGFKSSHGTWTQNYGSYSLMASGAFVPAGEGQMWEGEVSAYYNAKGPLHSQAEEMVLFKLPCVWYRRG